VPHNYYLYNDPDTGLLTWILWDNNEALQTGKRGGALTLDVSNLDADAWPLIGKIYGDEVYKARYDELLLEVISGAFETNSIQAIYDAYSALIEPYATTKISGYSFLRSDSDFYQGVDALNAHAEQRAEAVSRYLDGQ